MGDTGALSLGATIGVIAMLTNSVLILPFLASIFVIEASSSGLQLLWKRFFKKKLFLIAPLHHHFEAKGYRRKSRYALLDNRRVYGRCLG